MATSFAIQASNTNEWNEGTRSHLHKHTGIQLPDAVPGTGSLRIEAGVGRLPSILLLSEAIFASLNYRTVNFGCKE